MGEDTYKKLVEKIALSANLSIEDVERRIAAKRARLSGLISPEGAAQVLAAELNIKLEQQNFKISELSIGKRKVNILGKVIQIYPIRKFKKNDKEYELSTMIIADETDAIKVILWDTKHIEKIKANEIKENDVVEVINGDVRGTLNRELHLGSYSEISKSNEIIENPVIKEIKNKEIISNLADLKQNSFITVRATIVQIYQPAFFNVCSQCGMKVTFEHEKAVCPKHESVIPKERAILNFVVDDGTENIRAIAFGEVINEMYGITENDLEMLKDSGFNISKKSEILGKEYLLSGKVRFNALFDRNELVINRIRETNPEEIIEEMSKELKIEI